MFLIEWQGGQCTTNDEFSAISVFGALEKNGDNVYVYGTTGIRLDPHNGLVPYDGNGYYQGRIIKGGWQKLAELEREQG